MGADYSAFFDQYLHYVEIPVLEFRKNRKRVDVRWKVHAKGLQMPIDSGFVGDEQVYRLQVSRDWFKGKSR